MKEKNNIFIGFAIFISFLLILAGIILIPLIKSLNPDWDVILFSGKKKLDSEISPNTDLQAAEMKLSFSDFNELSITLRPMGQNKKNMILSKKNETWIDLANPDLEISQEKVSAILEELNDIKVLSRIDNTKKEDLKNFGFENPRLEVMCKNTKNEIKGFKIGNIVSTGYNCYLKINGENQVYIVDGMLLSMLEMTEEALQDSTTFHIPPEKEIKEIIIDSPGKSKITIKYDDTGRGYLTGGKYTSPQRLSNTSDDSTLSGEELVKERLNNLEESLIKDTGKDKFALYGLNKPANIVILKCQRPKYGKTITYEPYVKKIMFNLPDKRNDDALCYFISSDSDNIYYTSEMYLRALTEISPFRVISREIFMTDLNATEKISAVLSTPDNPDNNKNIILTPETGNFVPVLEESINLSGDLEIPLKELQSKNQEMVIEYHDTNDGLIDKLYFSPYDFVFYTAKSEKGNAFLIHKNKYKKFINLLTKE